MAAYLDPIGRRHYHWKTGVCPAVGADSRARHVGDAITR
jgi:hypothetical protein